MRKFLLVGLTGGIGTGKSTVSNLFRALGAEIIDADLLAREVVEPGEPALAQIAGEFGREVLHPDGTLDRKKLGAIIFADPARRKKLEQITHPAIRDRFVRHLDELEARGFAGIVFYDAPVMIEAGGHKAMDKLVVVATDEETQRARLRARDAIDETEARRKIGSQMPVAEKAKLADYVIDNAGDRAATERQVRRVFAGLMAEAAVATQLLANHPHRRTGPLGVVFPVNMGNRGRNEIPPQTVFRNARLSEVDHEIVGYHWRRSGNFIFLRQTADSESNAVHLVASITKLGCISRSFSALVQLSWQVPVSARRTAYGSMILDDPSGVWRLVALFLSDEVPAEKRLIGAVSPQIKLLSWPSSRDVLCAYDRPGEPGDVGQVTRKAVTSLRKVAALPMLVGSGRAFGVVHDILCGRNLRR